MPLSKNWNWHRVGAVGGGFFFMILGVFLIIPLPLDGDWYWDLSWLNLLLGIPMFILGLWMVRDGLRLPSLPPPSPLTVPLVDERILEEEREAEEVKEVEKLFDSEEKLLAIVVGNVDGEAGLNRLVLTGRRIIFYSLGKFQSNISFGYEQIDAVQGKKGKSLTWLGEINLSTNGKIVRFKDMMEQDVDQIVDIIFEMKQKAATQVKHTAWASQSTPPPRITATPPPSPSPTVVNSQKCPVCGSYCNWIEQYSRWYCPTCKEYR